MRKPRLAMAMAVLLGLAGAVSAAETSCNTCAVVLQSAASSQDAIAPDFVHIAVHPDKPDGSTIVLLHGSGGSETSLIDFARRAAPAATLIGVRGRILQDGSRRWYRRLSPVRFDQGDIRREADAFAAFLGRLVASGRLDPERTTFLGYSNGANLIGALSLLRPGLIRKAVLLRPMPVLDDSPMVDLAAARYLMIAGSADRLYAPFAPELEALLRGAGAEVSARSIEVGHLLGEADVRIVADWLAGGGAVAAAE